MPLSYVPKRLETPDNYDTKWNFLHYIGAINRKYMLIYAPAISGSTLYNYRGTFSVVLIAVADKDYTFI